MYQFDWGILASEYGWRLMEGTLVTLGLVAAALGLAALLGVVFGLIRWNGGRLLGPLGAVYVEFVRNTPPLVQILFWYFSASYILPAPLLEPMQAVGFEFGAAAFALGVYHGAFLAEVLRSGLQSIPAGQFEAARSLGLSSFQVFGSVIAPQVLRLIVPPLTSEVVSLTKNTSLALAVGVTELMYQARYIDVYTFRAVEALTAATVIYLVLCLILTAIGQAVDVRLTPRRKVHELAPSLD